MDLLSFVEIIKYILYGIGVIGLIITIAGAYRANRTLVQRGGMIIAIAVVLFICGYVIVRVTMDKADDYYMRELYNY